MVDYKTGKKSFSLSDVYYGLGLQMLLYLFTLSDAAPELYGYEGVPAGVLYVPARDVLISAQTDLTDAEIAEKRREALRRSGLLLGEPEALAAMEHTEGGGRLPIKWKDGAPAGESLASAEQLGALGAPCGRHTDGPGRRAAPGQHRGRPLLQGRAGKRLPLLRIRRRLPLRGRRGRRVAALPAAPGGLESLGTAGKG